MIYNQGMNEKIYTPDEVDRILRYPHGRSARLARKGLLPSIQLPDGEIRFLQSQIEQIICTRIINGMERKID